MRTSTGGKIVLCLLLIGSALGVAQADKVDDYVKAQMEKQHIPGLSLAAVLEGKVVLARGYGLANVELNVRATPDTVYEIGSITKQFTATAIMLLVEEGKIGLDDKISRYLDGTPDAWKDITVRHLLTHTSGIKDYTEVPDVDKLWRNDYTHDAILKLVTGTPLAFQPGEKWAYCNTGYFLLGMIVEKVSGKPYGEFVAERIFKPLGMTATRVNDEHAIIPNRAEGYTWANSALHNADYTSMTWPFAAGVLVSTVTDMAKWDAALYTNRLLKPADLQQMWTPARLNSGKSTVYGFGWVIDTYQGHRLIWHNGGIPGFITQISRFVDDKLTVIVLTNTEHSNPDTIIKGVAGILVPALVQVAARPIEDHDPKTTQRLRDILLSLVDGKADYDQFTPDMRATLSPDRVKQIGATIKVLGPLKSFQLLEQKTEDKKHSYRYRAVFGDTALIAGYVLTEDGKIATFQLRPE